MYGGLGASTSRQNVPMSQYAMKITLIVRATFFPLPTSCRLFRATGMANLREEFRHSADCEISDSNSYS